MKRFILAILFLCCLSIPVLAREANETEQETYRNYYGYYFEGVMDGTVGEDGYFAMDYLPSEKGYLCYVTYIDKESRQEIYLCAKPDCEHGSVLGQTKNEDCNAYVGSIMNWSLVWDSGYVYWQEYDLNTYDVTLMRMRANGSGETEKIGVLGQSPEQGSAYMFAINDRYYYFSYYDLSVKTSKEKEQVELKRLNLDTGEIELLYSLEEYEPNIAVMKSIGRDVYFEQLWFDEEDMLHVELMRCETETGRVEPVLDHEIHRYTAADENTLYYSVNGEGVYRYLVSEGTEELIWECDEQADYLILAYNGKNLFLENSYNDSFINPGCGQVMTVLEPDGTEIARIDMESRSAMLVDETYLLAEHFTEQGGTEWQVYPVDGEMENSDWITVATDGFWHSGDKEWIQDGN